MSLLPEVLNEQCEAVELRLGAYQSHQRRCVVVVKVAKGKLFYLKAENCTVELVESFKDKFLRDYPIRLANYPVMRAIRKLAVHIHEGYTATPEAARVIRAILKQ